VEDNDQMAENRVEHELSAVRRRPMLAGVLAGMVIVAVSIVLVAARNPWRYVYLIPFGRTAVVVTVLASSPTMLAVVTWLLVGKMRAARMIAGAVAALTALMCVFGSQISAAGSISGGTRTVVAVSPGGAFDLVVVGYIDFNKVEIVRVRSRAGLASREADQDLACFAYVLGDLESETTFESARFVGEHGVEVRTEAGEPWTTTFDPNTLLAAATVSHGC
jgi:hypothetical protein